MSNKLIIGTVRAVHNGRHVVAVRGGGTVDVVFDGDASPKMGGDVIGMLRRGSDGVPRMTLRTSIVDALLDGRAKITMAGKDKEMSARLLAKVLARSRTAVISPGTGVAIERAPTSADPDLDWAVAIFGQEADRLGIALNVIDVDTVSKSPWRPATLVDTALPADAASRGQVMTDLTKLLHSGFHPDCNRMIENISGENETSVNFVLPYSPYAGAFGFCRELSGMNRRFVPNIGGMSVSDARRLSSARHLALGLAHARLGANASSKFDASQSRRATHMANCFADAAAIIAFLSSGGDRRVAEIYADLKESSLLFGSEVGSNVLRPGILEAATHRSVRLAMKEDVIARATNPKAIMNEAVRIARRSALPASRFRNASEALTTEEYEQGNAVAKRVIADVANPKVGVQVETAYRNEIKALVKQHASSELSALRLVSFGGMHAPLHLMKVFDEETASLPRGVIKEADAKPTRKGLRRRRPDHASDDATLEFDIPMTP